MIKGLVNKFSITVLLLVPGFAFAQEGEAVEQVSYLTSIVLAIRDFIFIVMFIAGILVLFAAVIILVKDYVMADSQRGEKKFSIGELGLGVVLAGVLVSPYGLLQVGADAAGGSQDGDIINTEVFTDAQDNQSGGGN